MVAETRPRRGAILPHAPLLVPDVGRSRAEPPLERVRAAVPEAARDLGRYTVVISPHGASAGVYLRPRADLRAFGVPRASARVQVPETQARRLAAAWGKPILDDPADHGVVVPVLMGALGEGVIGVALGEQEDPDDDAAELAAALSETELDVVASINTGAGITPRAPLTQLEGTASLEQELRAALTGDVASVEDVAHRLRTQAGSCCLGPLLVLARLFAGQSADVLAHEWPFGVGYLVARIGGER